MAKRADKSWERQKNESAKAYEAFSIYLDMGADRSLRKVWKKLGKSKALIERWSSTYNWVERCRDRDNYIRQQAMKDEIKARKEMNDWQMKFAKATLNLVLKSMKEKGEDLITSQNFAAVGRFCTELERLAINDNLAILEREQALEESGAEEDSASHNDVLIYLPDNGRDSWLWETQEPHESTEKGDEC